jgi:hypothetical protein
MLSFFRSRHIAPKEDRRHADSPFVDFDETNIFFWIIIANFSCVA